MDKMKKLEFAVQCRNDVYNNFVSWTNQYLIINGALFAGLYNVYGKKAFQPFSLLICIAGLIVTFFWIRSNYGYIKTIDRYNDLVRSVEDEMIRKGEVEEHIAHLDNIGAPSTKWGYMIFACFVFIGWMMLVLCQEVRQVYIVCKEWYATVFCIRF